MPTLVAAARNLLLVIVAFVTMSAAAQAQVVISQVYGGGGNAGATLKNDFIEIFNRGNVAVNITGWSLQYASTAGTTWQVTSLSGIIQPGQYYLIQEAQGAGGSVNLPTPDATGTIAMSATGAKVALLNTTTALSGSGCPFAADVQDFVGYDGANCFETAATAALTNTTAALRGGGGCTDTNSNSADFSIGSPAPRNTASTLNVCAGALTITTASPLPDGTVSQAYSVTFAASGGTGSGYMFSQVSGTFPPGLTLTGATLSGTPTTTTGSPFDFTMQVTDSGADSAQKLFQLTVNAAPTCTPTHTIAQIQGNGDTSPLAGTTNITTSGIVIGRKSNGFFIQMPSPGDGDTSTSDGIFIFTSAAPPASVVVGSDVCVTGTVQEFVPNSDPSSPSLTELTFTTSIFATTTGNALPPPVVLTAADTNPAGALLQLEKYEGMRTQVNTLTVVAPTRGNVNEANATGTSAGIFYGVISGLARPFREPGIQMPDPVPSGSPCCVPRWDTNPEVLSVNSLGQTGGTALDVTVGQTVSNIVGPIEYSQRAFTIDPDPATPPAVSGAPLTAVAVPQSAGSEVTVASFNMQRFFDTIDEPVTSDAVLTATAFNNRLNKASLAIRDVMRYPDIIGVEEMENLSTLQALANKVNNDAVAAGDPNPNYQAYLVEGNDIGGIDVGFLVGSLKVNVADVTQYGKDTTYIDPNTKTPATLNDRPPLVLRATVVTQSAASLPVTVIVNHLRSLSGVSDPTDGPRVRAKREAQAEYLANLIQDFQNADPGVNLVSIGDYNAFQFSDGYVDVMGVITGTPVPANQVVTPPSTITNPTLTDLVETASPDQRYSYSFNGNAQELDHILVNGNMGSRQTRYAVARNDADFPETVRNDPNRPERISDHDMPVAYFSVTSADVSSRVSVIASGLIYSRLTRTYNGTVTITNNSQQAINGPIQALFQISPPGVTLANASGVFNGNPYITASTSSLAAGQSVTFQVRFNNPSNALINATVRTYSGTF